MIRVLRKRLVASATVVRHGSAASVVDCSRVFVQKDAYDGAGAFAAVPIKRGALVESGIARRLPVDGNRCPYVFTWSEDKTVWATGSGCSVFYNAALDGSENTEMTRVFNENRFEIRATRDIVQGEELTHLYKSIEWRDCFRDLKVLRAVQSKSKTGAPPSVVTKNTLSLVDCAKVYVKVDTSSGVASAFAAVHLKAGEIVETGIVRRLPMDGNRCPYVFSWSEDRTVWASGSGSAAFYNTAVHGNENTQMKRFFEEDRFEIVALRDIKKDEELTNEYKSIKWRPVFEDLKEKLEDSEPGGQSERSSFIEYWGQDHGAPTLENMMLDSGASDMDRLERPEILSMLPSLTGKRVLELGAGIGRFSGMLAQKADSVVAVDFVQASCEENRRINAACTNLEVLQMDATLLEMDKNSFELVFTNWLLMYFTDDEVEAFAQKVLTWLKPGGRLFFRESCFHASGNVVRRFNPTRYRTPEDYSHIFSAAALKNGARFQLVGTNCVESYAKMKGNTHQMWFLWEKVGAASSERRARSLQVNQFSLGACMRYEKIYGENYVHVGGEAVSKQIWEACKDWLKPGARVLDLGCGLGGTVRYLAEHSPGVFFHAVSIDTTMMTVLAGRQVRWPADLRQRISVQLESECGVPEHELKYPPNSCDVVVIREALVYMDAHDQQVLLQKVSRLLRPGGRLVIVDKGLGPGAELDAEFQAYLDRWGYFLQTPEAQKTLLSRHFKIESHLDQTQQFVKFTREGLDLIEEHFGPASSARQRAVDPSDIEKLTEPATALVQKLLPNLPELAAEEAVDAVRKNLALYVESLEEEVKRTQVDYEWAREVWEAECRASEETHFLKWSFTTATKP